MKRITLALAALLTLGFASCDSSNTPESAVNDFYSAMQANDIEKSLTYTNLSSDRYEELASSLEQFGLVIVSFETLSTIIDEGDTTATVTTHLVTTNAYNPDTVGNNIEVPCIKVDGKWKMMMMY